jgi:hypothetical protein
MIGSLAAHRPGGNGKLRPSQRKFFALTAASRRAEKRSAFRLDQNARKFVAIGPKRIENF